MMMPHMHQQPPHTRVHVSYVCANVTCPHMSSHALPSPPQVFQDRLYKAIAQEASRRLDSLTIHQLGAVAAALATADQGGWVDVTSYLRQATECQRMSQLLDESDQSDQGHVHERGGAEDRGPSAATDAYTVTPSAVTSTANATSNTSISTQGPGSSPSAPVAHQELSSSDNDALGLVKLIWAYSEVLHRSVQVPRRADARQWGDDVMRRDHGPNLLALHIRGARALLVGPRLARLAPPWSTRLMVCYAQMIEVLCQPGQWVWMGQSERERVVRLCHRVLAESARAHPGWGDWAETVCDRELVERQLSQQGVM